MSASFSPEQFVINYPEFETLLGEGQRIQTANRIATVAGTGWCGFDSAESSSIAHDLMVAHVLTTMVDGSSPVSKYSTKESNETLDTQLRAKPAATLSLHTTDYGVLLLDLIYMNYDGVGYYT